MEEKMNASFKEIDNNVFTICDQLYFAKFSGDNNPIHTNQEKSKKTLTGGCIVHGINLFLWALDSYVTHTKKMPKNFKIKFIKPVYINTKVKLLWIETKGLLQIVSEKQTLYCSINYNYSKNSDASFQELSLPEMLILSEPLEKELNNITLGSVFESHYGGELKLGYSIYPNLIQKLGENIVYEISILSNIVGMQLPGLNSLFSSCSITFVNSIGYKKPFFKLINYDDRFRLINITYTGKNIEANIDAFERPVYEPKNCSFIKTLIPKTLTLKGKKILVVGGSRGIGAAFAKVAALLGGEVTITFTSSKSDALSVFEDIKQHSSSIVKVIELDVTSSVSLDSVEFDHDILCYFASSKIFGKSGNSFDVEIFDKFYQFYCYSFELIARRFFYNGGKTIYYPSSIAVEERIKGLEEYAIAKKLGEKICASLISEFNSEIIIDRLGRVETDQTLSILQVPTLDPIDVAIGISHKLINV